MWPAIRVLITWSEYVRNVQSVPGGRAGLVRCRDCGDRVAEGIGDWTIKNDVYNSSALFVSLSEDVAQIIRNSAHALLNGDADDVGRLIMAQLAHKHGLAHDGEVMPPVDAPSVLSHVLDEEINRCRVAVQAELRGPRCSSAEVDFLIAQVGWKISQRYNGSKTRP